MSIITRLPPDTINRIAAGEVVERPASAVKELVENALDAGARHIHVRADQGGLERIIVEDDGCGMGPEDLSLCVERHATSKLKPQADGSWDLLHITSLGFRGEALPSMGSVARLHVTSRLHGTSAHAISVDAGRVSDLRPAAFAGDHGTRIDLSDLFFATPARLKFMKSARSESLAITEELKRQAMAHPHVAFTLELDGKRVFRHGAESDDFAGRLKRLGAILGADFTENALLIDQNREGVQLSGYASLPTYSRGNGLHQYLFVNNRPVKDRLLQGALRGAYADFLARDRHPVAALYLSLDPELLDVNVHPAKTEVRFRDPALVRGLIIGSIKHALAAQGHRASNTVAAQALVAFRAHTQAPRPYQPLLTPGITGLFSPAARQISPETSSYSFSQTEILDRADENGVSEPTFVESTPDFANEPDLDDFPLGAAMAQVHATYIVAQTQDGLVIVDQHAAHERLVYEGLKTAVTEGSVEAQSLLIPEVVDLDPAEQSRLLRHRDTLSRIGLEIEAFGPGAVLVRALPARLGDMDCVGLVRDIADQLSNGDEAGLIQEMILEKCADYACRHSIRAGRKLTQADMTSLLRQMETTPHSGQCNHGRPTYVELKLKDIEKLFGRR